MRETDGSGRCSCAAERRRAPANTTEGLSSPYRRAVHGYFGASMVTIDVTDAISIDCDRMTGVKAPIDMITTKMYRMFFPVFSKNSTF